MCNSSRPTGSFRCTRPPVARRLSTTMNVSYHEACPALRTPQGWPESLGTGGRFPSEQPAEFIGMRIFAPEPTTDISFIFPVRLEFPSKPSEVVFLSYSTAPIPLAKYQLV